MAESEEEQKNLLLKVILKRWTEARLYRVLYVNLQIWIFILGAIRRHYEVNDEYLGCFQFFPVIRLQ